MVVADRKIDGLVRLEQEGWAAPPRVAENNALEQLIDDVMAASATPGPRGAGRRCATASPGLTSSSTRPRDRTPTSPRSPSTGAPTRPSAWCLRADPAPSRLAVRLKELGVISNRSFLRARVRVDALVVTAVPADAGAPYAAGTARFDRVQDGDRLPFDDLLVYEGPVGRFLDIAVWVSRDDARDRDLSELLATELSGKEVAGAITALAGPRGGGPIGGAGRRLGRRRHRAGSHGGPGHRRRAGHEHRHLSDVATGAPTVRRGAAA